MSDREPIPGAEKVTTPAGRALMARPVFAAIGRGKHIGGHVAINGYDLARVEEQAFARGVASSLGRLPSTPEVGHE